jgi:hypothetical protein
MEGYAFLCFELDEIFMKCELGIHELKRISI